jgi:hypothetical protein
MERAASSSPSARVWERLAKGDVLGLHYAANVFVASLGHGEDLAPPEAAKPDAASAA